MGVLDGVEESGGRSPSFGDQHPPLSENQLSAIEDHKNIKGGRGSFRVSSLLFPLLFSSIEISICRPILLTW